MREGGLEVAGLEYLEASDGRQIFYDVNANSNLRPPIARAFGFDPFERVVDYLLRELRRSVEPASAAQELRHTRATKSPTRILHSRTTQRLRCHAD